MGHGPSVVKIDIGLGREVDRFELLDGPTGSWWPRGRSGSRCRLADTTLRLDPETGEVEHRFADLPGSLALAYGDGSIWTAGWTSPDGGFTGSGGVNRIDPDTNAVTKDRAGPAAGLLPGRGRRWVRVDGRSDEGRRLQDRPERPRGGDLPDGPGRGHRVLRRRHRLGRELRCRHGLGGGRAHRRPPDVPRSSIPSRASRPAPASWSSRSARGGPTKT